MVHSDICIAGAGIIGPSLALELHDRGITVTVLDAGSPMQQASSAAAGMLAADDPHNPAELSELSHLSLSLYPGFLDRVLSLSGMAVPLQTQRTLQALPANPASTLPPELVQELLIDHNNALPSAPGFAFLKEHSIDPRQLAPALVAAVAATSICVHRHSPVLSIKEAMGSTVVRTPTATIEAGQFVDCTGAWAGSFYADTPFRSVPVKGQMLALASQPNLRLKTVLRTEDIYLVPRTLGPAAGLIIVGATVEDAGFDQSVDAAAIEALRQRALSLIPALGQVTVADSWAGLRPGTADRLPIIGPHPERDRQWLATGHYRNGILLTPATAHVMADLILNRTPAVSLAPFSPSRLAIKAAMSIK